MLLRSSRSLAVAAIFLAPGAATLMAQTPTPIQTPAQPTAQTQRPAPANSEAPAAPTAQARSTALPPMPPVDQKNFTAATPTVDTVNAFLKASWGYDPARIWQVQAVQKTPVQGVSHVVVLVEEKGSGQQQPSPLSFFTLPDGKHLIADEVLPFGARPFEDYRTLLQKQAGGPSKGAASTDLMLVEFADFECPHCKEVQPMVDRLLSDFPNAHYVYENYPLTQIHSEAEKAAEYGVCVAKLGGNPAFFKYADAVYANQTGLTPQSSADTLKMAVKRRRPGPGKGQLLRGNARDQGRRRGTASVG